MEIFKHPVVEICVKKELGYAGALEAKSTKKWKYESMEVSPKHWRVNPHHIPLPDASRISTRECTGNNYVKENYVSLVSLLTVLDNFTNTHNLSSSFMSACVMVKFMSVCSNDKR